MLQIIWERRFINPELNNKEVVRNYSVNGKKGDDGIVIPSTNLKEIISNLPDFKQELTLLQFRAKQLGVRVDCSPKYHPEITGEGI